MSSYAYIMCPVIDGLDTSLFTVEEYKMHVHQMEYDHKQQKRT